MTPALCFPQEHLQVQTQVYRNLFEELAKKDLAVFEERRLQDVLLCRSQAPHFSVKDEDFHTLWEHRLTELLDRRQLYLQVSSAALKTLIPGSYVNIAAILGRSRL